MVCYTEVKCPCCRSTQVKKSGITKQGKQRYKCGNESCEKCTFLLDYTYNGCRDETKAHIINSSGIRDIARVLQISMSTVIQTIRSKTSKVLHVHPDITRYAQNKNAHITLQLVDLDAELDEQWSFVCKKTSTLVMVCD